MRSAAYSALRNNRSFVPFCRAEKGCIWLQVLPVLDGNSVILCGTTSIQYLCQVRAWEERVGWNVLSGGVARFIMHVPL